MDIGADLQKRLTVVANSMNCQFLLKGEPIKTEKVFSPSGLLPAMMRRADQLCSLCLGHGLGVTFERSDGAMLGVVVVLNDQVPMVLRLLCATDILAELVQGSPSIKAISVDMLAAD
jgi:intracellular multiplication protein IcmS